MQQVQIFRQASAARRVRQLAAVLASIGISVLETSLRFPVLPLIDLYLRQNRDQALLVAMRIRAFLPCPSLSKENSHV